jgi:hypothetical protein
MALAEETHAEETFGDDGNELGVSMMPITPNVF